jgi:hypothetical protein
MTLLSETHLGVLRKYARPLVHMRAQSTQSRFSLIFGAGLSKPFGIPDWPRLVCARTNKGVHWSANGHAETFDYWQQPDD